MPHRTPSITRAYLCPFVLLVLTGVACHTPDPPHQATAQQVSQMDSEINGSSGVMAGPVDFGPLIERLSDGGSPEDRDFALREYVLRANALPPAERARRLQELERILRANQEAR